MSVEYLDDDDFDPRETRLQAEFAEMRELLRPGSLIDFNCARMTQEELDEWLRPRVSMEVVGREAQSFAPVEEFLARSPGAAPDKYLIRYRCRGVARVPRPQAELAMRMGRQAAPQLPEADELFGVDEHLMQISLGLDYLDQGPHLLWITPIFHPNIIQPVVCDRGRPFAPGTPLKSVCLMVGQMVQYRQYNLEDALDEVAKEWTSKNKSRLPLDRRDLLTGEIVGAPLVEMVEAERPARRTGGPAVEWM
jgi:hypothetical protein